MPPYLQDQDQQGRREGQSCDDAPHAAPVASAQLAQLLARAGIACMRVRAVLRQEVSAQHPCRKNTLLTRS